MDNLEKQFIVSMVESETLTMQLCSVVVKPVDCVRPEITVDS